MAKHLLAKEVVKCLIARGDERARGAFDQKETADPSGSDEAATRCSMERTTVRVKIDESTTVEVFQRLKHPTIERLPRQTGR